MAKTIPTTDLPDHIGKEAARKLLESAPYPGGQRVLAGEDLQVGLAGQRLRETCDWGQRGRLRRGRGT